MSSPLSELTKQQLLDIARDHQIVGRSRMNKAELISAIEALEGKPESATDTRSHYDVSERRSALAARLDSFIDHSKSCNWRSVEGHPCGLPVVRNSERCSLHGGIDNTDLAIPAMGRLGFDTWPTLLRHVWLASYDIDPIGLDPVIAEMTWHLTNYLYFEYFKVEVEGVENIPTDGGVLLAANHGGAALPYDAMMLTLAVTNEMPIPRRPRIMATEIFNATPTLSHLYRKIGGVYASRADAAYLLEEGHMVGVFPEGVRAFQKPFSRPTRCNGLDAAGF